VHELKVEVAMSARTKQNLNTAMQGEAFNHAKCLRFAAHARMNENWNVAQLFQTTADTDRREHFAEEADLAGCEASDTENLRSAIEGKRADAAMYGQFAREATADGDFVAAALFEKMQTAVDTQRKAFEAAFRIQTRARTDLVAV
jgi:rubrerythrin